MCDIVYLLNTKSVRNIIQMMNIRGIGATHRNKYRNKKTEYNGVMYDSKKEALYAYHLTMRQRAHDIKSWERQIAIPLIVNGKKICKYVADFRVVYNDDTEEYIEVKGFETAVYKLKKKLLEALYPDVKLTVVK